MIEKDKHNIIQRILNIGKEKDLGEYNRKLLNKIWKLKKN